MMTTASADTPMKVRGVVYDVGLQFNKGFYSVDTFDVERVRYDMGIISNILHANAVRIEGESIGRLTAAARVAREYGLRVFFNPWLMGGDAINTPSYMARAAKAAEQLRQEGMDIVFVAGCEYSVFCNGIFDGSSVMERVGSMVGLMQSGDSVGMEAAMARLNATLADICKGVRARFKGLVTYASGTWEKVDWSLFDVVGVDYYRDAQTEEAYREGLRAYGKYGKPVYVMEVGCCAYEGAAARGGGGFAILQGTTPDGQSIYEGGITPKRSETEQADYIRQQTRIINSAGVDGMFVYVFSFPCSPYREDGLDSDMTAYGLVKHFPKGSARSRMIPAWAPKEAFYAVAESYMRLKE